MVGSGRRAGALPQSAQEPFPAALHEIELAEEHLPLVAGGQPGSLLSDSAAAATAAAAAAAPRPSALLFITLIASLGG